MAQRRSLLASLPAALACLALLAACGNRGSLYLPDETPPPTAATAAETPEDREDADDERSS